MNIIIIKKFHDKTADMLERQVFDIMTDVDFERAEYLIGLGFAKELAIDLDVDNSVIDELKANLEELTNKIAELETIIVEKDSQAEELTNKIAELETEAIDLKAKIEEKPTQPKKATK